MRADNVQSGTDAEANNGYGEDGRTYGQEEEMSRRAGSRDSSLPRSIYEKEVDSWIQCCIKVN